MLGPTIIITVFVSVMAVSCAVWVGLYLRHRDPRPVNLLIPSVYWPLASLGFSKNRTFRRAFHFLFCDMYRKKFWDPLINSWAKDRGFDRRRHLFACNTHAAVSGMMLSLLLLSLYCAHRATEASLVEVERRWYFRAGVAAVVEFIGNLPAIVLSRYLYLLTLCRPRLCRSRQGC